MGWSVRNEEVKEAFKFMGLLWPFMKKYWNVPTDPAEFDRYWEQMRAEADSIVQQFPEPERHEKSKAQLSPYSGFACCMMIGFFNYVDEKRKGLSK